MHFTSNCPNRFHFQKYLMYDVRTRMYIYDDTELVYDCTPHPTPGSVPGVG